MLPTIDCSLAQARVYTEQDRLIVTTGRVQRVWRLTKMGLSTCSLTQLQTQMQWQWDRDDCDWQLPDATEPGRCELCSMTAAISDDERFTNEHISVTAEFKYPDSGLILSYEIWAYPDACGLRTQLSARLIPDAKLPEPRRVQGGQPSGRVERLPVNDPSDRRRLVGYYNHTQVRNDTHQDIIAQEVMSHRLQGREHCDWASAACLESDRAGIALVKESHKCVNQSGYVSGGFFIDEQQGLICHGWGLRLKDLKTDTLTRGWATWSLCWSGGDFERELAFKQFDRQRYPIDPKRDIYIQANTWGSTDNGNDARRAAGPQRVLQELEVCSELGIDVLQIDDGWQVPPGCDTWDPGENGWYPHPQHYPDGWEPVRKRASELGVKLGLWAAAESVGLEELMHNYERGGFVQFKLDFAMLRQKHQIDALMHKVREFIKSTDHQVRVNWDVTENPARYGYFFAREYGCIYLENRKPSRPLGVIYRPHTVLRDLWQIARYLNLNRFQCSIQNVDRVDSDHSDAHLHSHGYATAIALMGIPLFFQEVKYYSDEAKAEIRSLLETYKAHREAIYHGVVHPIGEKPNNASWTGFQCSCDDGGGYLMIFRERCNAESKKALALRGLPPGLIHLENLVTGHESQQLLGDAHAISLEIAEAPGFQFLRYDMQA